METRRVRLPVEESWPEADLRRPYLIGIAGAGMSALARVLLGTGAQVSGSDQHDSPQLAALAAAGATVHSGHEAEHVAGASCVITSTAVEESNVELVEAWRRGIPVVHRAQALAQLIGTRRSGVLVTGTHGKTTVTSMLVHILTQTGADPTYAFGADWTQPATGGHLGAGQVFVAEADESDRSFRWMHPGLGLAVVTSIDDDHVEQYPTRDALADEVTAWLLDMPGAAIVANADDPRVAAATDIADRERTTYGRSTGADVRILHIEAGTWMSEADLCLPSGEQVRLRVNVPGQHMARNAVAALTAALSLGVDASATVAALETYLPVQRRLTIHGEAAGVRVVDSFAQHPVEIRADIEAIDVAGGRLVVAFRPSGHLRVETLGQRMGSALATADEVVLLPIRDPYSARPSTAALRIGDAISECDVKVTHATGHEGARAALAKAVRPGDIVITMGAGDVSDLGAQLLADLTPEPLTVPEPVNP